MSGLRLDLIVLKSCELGVRALESQCGISVWDGLGVRQVVERGIAAAKVTDKPVTSVDFARWCGALPPVQVRKRNNQTTRAVVEAAGGPQLLLGDGRPRVGSSDAD